MSKGRTLKEVAAEKLTDCIFVQGIEVVGVTRETVDDFEFTEVLAVMSDPDAEPAEKLRATAAAGPIVFGKEQWKRIKAELRAQNDGRLPNKAVMDFIDATLVELNAKN